MKRTTLTVLLALLLLQQACSDELGLGIRGLYGIPAGGLASGYNSAFGWSLSAEYGGFFFEDFSFELRADLISYPGITGGLENEDELAFIAKYGVTLSRGVDSIWIFAGSGVSFIGENASTRYGAEYKRKLDKDLNLRAVFELSDSQNRSGSGTPSSGTFVKFGAGLNFDMILERPAPKINDAEFLNNDARIREIAAAFNTDDFNVDLTPGKGIFDANHSRGVLASHKSAAIGASTAKKKALYIEGSPYEMGYLTGLMAEKEVERMCVEFNRQVVFDFISVKIQDEKLKAALGDIISDLAAFDIALTGMPLDFPREYRDEIDGIYDGCKRADPDTQVTRKALWVLNAGIDALLSFIYTGKLPDNFSMAEEYKTYFSDPGNFKTPLFCNGLTLSGSKLENGGMYFGRDFMFPTADTYQDVACYIIRRPAGGAIPTVSLAAPGMIGAPAGMNLKNIGVGIDMSPAGNCDPKRPGLNSLLMNRYAIEYGNSIDEAIDRIAYHKRGVSWMYILADGNTNRSCSLESGMSAGSLDLMSYVPKDIRDSGILPDAGWIRDNPSAGYKNGVMLRWNDWKYPSGWLDKNGALMEFVKQYKTKLVPLALLLKDYDYTYDQADFEPLGYLNKTKDGKNCPAGFYFAPQREDMEEMLLVSNHCIIPEMRLCAMNEWTQFITSGNIQDIQWRYDELNKQAHDAINAGPVGYSRFKRLINFLSPQFMPDYYNKEGKPLDQVFVHGSISVMDLKENVIDSLYGYYSDQWVKISLREYFK